MPGMFNQAMKEKTKAELEELLRIIDEVKENGGSLEDLKEHLEEHFPVAREKLQRYKHGEGWDFDREKGEAIFAENDYVRLIPLTDGDKEFFLKVRRQWDVFIESIIDKQTEKDVTWESTRHKNCFYCIAEDKSGVKLGYIALKDTTRNLWEVALELEREHCYHGYGEIITQLFLRKIREITGKTQFQALVEIENIASQRCLKKMSAKFVDTYRFDFLSEEDAEKFESENMEKITPQMIALAEELDVEPRELLSHVLDYRIIVE